LALKNFDLYTYTADSDCFINSLAILVTSCTDYYAWVYCY